MSTTVVDAFSGVGGLALGWMELPDRPVRHLGAIDSDETLGVCYARNFPDTRFIAHRFGDPFSESSQKETAVAVRRIVEQVDVLLAAPPCQPFSAAGKRSLGVEAYLGLHVCALVEHWRPRILVMENVPQFGRVLGGTLAGRVRVRLGRAGFVTAVVTLDAVNFGVPQRRARALLLALRADEGQRAATRTLTDVVESLRHEQGRGEAGVCVTVGEAIGDLPSLEAGAGEEETRIVASPSTEYQRRLRQPNGVTYNHVAANHSEELVERIRSVEVGEAPQAYGDHPLRRKQYFRLAYARLSPDEPASTLTTNTHNPGSGRFLHYRDHRTLTVREVARLQGFPDWFRFAGSQTEQRRHVGNAVPPPLSRRVAEVLTAAGV